MSSVALVLNVLSELQMIGGNILIGFHSVSGNSVTFDPLIQRQGKSLNLPLPLQNAKKSSAAVRSLRSDQRLRQRYVRDAFTEELRGKSQSKRPHFLNGAAPHPANEGAASISLVAFV